MSPVQGDWAALMKEAYGYHTHRHQLVSACTYTPLPAPPPQCLLVCGSAAAGLFWSPLLPLPHGRARAETLSHFRSPAQPPATPCSSCCSPVTTALMNLAPFSLAREKSTRSTTALVMSAPSRMLSTAYDCTTAQQNTHMQTASSNVSQAAGVRAYLSSCMYTIHLMLRSGCCKLLACCLTAPQHH